MSTAPPAYRPVATYDEVVRGEFIVRVYQHLLAAVVAFIAIEALFINLGVASALYDLLTGSGYAWLLILGGFMIVSWLATNAAHDILNPSRQYLGLFGLAFAEALLFAPFLHYFFEVQADGTTTVMAAALITVVGFAGLTAGRRSSPAATSPSSGPSCCGAWSSALVLIVAAVLFGLELGVWFSVAMIALAGASILYQTQTIIRRYPAEAYVGASVQLFASVMLLFWYVLRLVGQLRG